MSRPKQNSSSQSGALQRTLGKYEVLSAKKTEQDYFSGTREEKKIKKKKGKNEKSVLSFGDLNDYVNLAAQRNEQKIESLGDSNEIPIFNSPIVPLRKKHRPKRNITYDTAWSTTTNVVDKLFPNVQSVVIYRTEEMEMLAKAAAQDLISLPVIRSESPLPEKENQSDTEYGTHEDESGWDNVRRNLPLEMQTMKPESDTSNRRTNFDNEKKTTRCSKSVLCTESVTTKVHSSVSRDDLFDMVLKTYGREPNIDKFGRVDGYSEKRLFMGKGARMKEQIYIQHKCSMRMEDVHQNVKPNSQATAITRTQKHGRTKTKWSKIL